MFETSFFGKSCDPQLESPFVVASNNTFEMTQYPGSPVRASKRSVLLTKSISFYTDSPESSNDLRVHFASDFLGSFLVTIMWLSLTFILMETIEKKSAAGGL